MKLDQKHLEIKNSKPLVVSYFCYAIAGCYFLIAALFFLQPAVQRIRIGSTDEAFINFFRSYAGNPWSHMWVHIVATMMSLLALAVVPVFSTLSSRKDDILSRWSNMLGLLGYSVFAVANARSINGEYDFAKIFVTLGDAEMPLAIASGKMIELERLGVITFGCVAIWVLVTAIKGIKSKVFPGWLGAIGVGFALTNILIIGDFWPYLGVGKLAQIAIGLGGAILGPIWFLGLGGAIRGRAE